MRYLTAFIVSLALAVYSAPYLIKDQVLIWLKQQGVQAPQLKSISINWLKGKVTIDQLVAETTQSAETKLPPLNVERLELEVSYNSLFDQQLLIKKVHLVGLNSGVSQQQKEMFLGPINLSQFESNSPETQTDESPSSWKVGINSFVISKLAFSTEIPGINHRLIIDSASLKNLRQWSENQQSQFSIKGALNNAAIDIRGQATPLAKNKKSQIKIAFEDLDLRKLASSFAPQLSGIASADLDLTLDLNIVDNKIQGSLEHQGEIGLNTFTWQQDQQETAVEGFTWQGKGRIDLQNTALNNANLVGKLAAKKLAISDKGKPQIALEAFNWELNSTAKNNDNSKEKQQFEITSLDKISVKDFALTQAGQSVSLSELLVQSAKDPLKVELIDNQLTRLSVPYSVAIKQLAVAQGKQSVNLGALSLALAKALQLSFNNNTISQITGTPDLQLSALKLRDPQQQLNAKSLSLKGPLSLTNKANSWSVNTDSALLLSGLNASLIKRLNISSDSLNVKAKVNSPLDQLSIANLNLQGTNLAVDTVANPMRLAQIKSLKVDGVKLDSKRISVGNVSAAQIQVAKRSKGTGLTQIGTLDINAISLANQSNLKINTVKISNTNSQLFIDEAARLPLLDDLNHAIASIGDGANQPAQTTSPSTKGTSASFKFAIDKLSISGNNTIAIEDQSVDPWFKSNVNIKQLDIANISSANPSSPITLKAIVNDEANLDLSAQVKLLDPAQFADWKVSLNSLSMPVISPYAGKFSGYFLESGKLSLNSQGKIESNKLSGENKITIEQLAVRSADSDATSKTNSSLSMPLDVAISVLEDDAGNIKLAVPISGSLDDPNFGYSSIVEIIAKKGLKKAAFGILSKALQPYGALITIATTAIDAKNSGSFINLAPVYFAPGDPKVDKKMRGYLVKIGKMMKQRKKLKLKICATGVQQDHNALSLVLNQSNAKLAKPLTPADLDKKILNELQALADSRGKAVEKFLVNQKIDKKRLFVCFAKTNLKKAKLKPNVSLGL